MYYPFLHSTVHCVHATHNGSSGGMQEWVIQIPSIPILVSVLFPSLHLKYFRIKFLLLVCIVFMCMRKKTTPTSGYKLSHTHIVVGS